MARSKRQSMSAIKPPSLLSDADFKAFATRKLERSLLLACLPPGADPIATRLDPSDGSLQVACADGALHKIPLGMFRAAELRHAEQRSNDSEAPRDVIAIVDQALAEKRAAMLRNVAETMAKNGEKLTPQKAQAEVKSLEQKWDEREVEKLQEYMKRELEEARKAREQHRQRSAPPPPQPRAFLDMWEMAEARYAEWFLAQSTLLTPQEREEGGPLCPIGSCTAVADVMLRRLTEGGRDFDKENPEWPVCAPCARKLLSTHPFGMALLDWNPEE
jgi:hypothetical protein